MAGRLRTASIPSSTVIVVASYCAPPGIFTAAFSLFSSVIVLLNAFLFRRIIGCSTVLQRCWKMDSAVPPYTPLKIVKSVSELIIYGNMI
jgi:hypothetical protein